MQMSEAAYACVVDANVILKLYFQQDGSDKARALFALLRSEDTRFYVPDLVYAECVNAFAQFSRLAAYPAREAREDLADLLQLRLHVVPTAELALQALDISLRHQVAGYDACYVALAQRVNAPLITADEKLVRGLAGKGLPVRSLASFDVPGARP
jgi:predicted nucleic acid-binding protein